MTPIPIGDAKRALRQDVRARMKELTPARRAEASAQARTLLAQQTRWRSAQSILFFAPMPGELDLWPLLAEALAAGKTAALPRYDAPTQSYRACRIENTAEDLEMGHFGIREPNLRCAVDSLDRFNFILVPGVAFDVHGRRLGRGKGFYDRLLATVRGTTCGVAFDEQLVSEIPVEQHDIRLNCLLTPTCWREV